MAEITIEEIRKCIEDRFLYVAKYDPNATEMPICLECSRAVDDHKANCIVPLVYAALAEVDRLKAENERLEREAHESAEFDIRLQ